MSRAKIADIGDVPMQSRYVLAAATRISRIYQRRIGAGGERSRPRRDGVAENSNKTPDRAVRGH